MADIRQKALQIKWSHELIRVEGGAQWRHHAFIQSFSALYVLVACLLLDSGVRKRFRYCQYKKCTHPFFVIEEKKKIGAPEQYCDPKHTLLENAADSKARQTRRRAISGLTKNEPYWSNKKATATVQELMARNASATAKQIVDLAKGAGK